MLGFFMGCLEIGCGRNTAPKDDSENVFPMDHSQIASGEIYEIKDSGITTFFEHTFTDTELQRWNDIYSQSVSKTLDGVIDNTQIKYMVFLYDADGNGLEHYIMDTSGELFDGHAEGQHIQNKEISKLIQEIIKQQ